MNILKKYHFDIQEKTINNCINCNTKKDYYSLLEPFCKVCFMHKHFENLNYIIGIDCKNYLDKFLNHINTLYNSYIDNKDEKEIIFINNVFQNMILIIKKATKLFYENAYKEYFKLLFDLTKQIDTDYNTIKEKFNYLVNGLENKKNNLNEIEENLEKEIEKILISLHNNILFLTKDFEIDLEKQYFTKMFFIFDKEFVEKII